MDRETVAKWFEFDYLPRVGAYRKDCKIGCDACIPKHDGDNYCDIDMLSKVLSLLKEREAVKPKIDAFGHPYCPKCKILVYETWEFCPHCGKEMKWKWE